MPKHSAHHAAGQVRSLVTDLTESPKPVLSPGASKRIPPRLLTQVQAEHEEAAAWVASVQSQIEDCRTRHPELTDHEREELLRGYVEPLWPPEPGQPDASRQLVTWFPIQLHESIDSVVSTAIASGSQQLGMATRDPALLKARATAEGKDGVIGTAEECLQIIGFALDFDCKGGSHAEEDLPTEEEALKVIATSSPGRPTVLIYTGGGFQGHWLLTHPIDVGPESRRMWEGFQAFTAARIKIDERNGLLSSSWRLPYVHNDKYGGDVLPGVVAWGPRYSISEFERFSEFAPSKSTRKAVHVKAVPPHVGLALKHLGITENDIEKNGDGTIRKIEPEVCPICKGVKKHGGTSRRTALVVPSTGAIHCMRETCRAHDGLDLVDYVWKEIPEVADKVLKLLEKVAGKLPEGTLHVRPRRTLTTVKFSVAEADGGETLNTLREAAKATGGFPPLPTKKAPSKHIPPLDLDNPCAEVGPPDGPTVSIVEIPTAMGKSHALDELVAARPFLHAIAHPTHDLIHERIKRLQKRGVPYVHYQSPQKACLLPGPKKLYEHRRDFRERVCADCELKKECPAWVDLSKGSGVLLCTSAAVPHLAKFVGRTEKGQPFVPFAERILWHDECPPTHEATVLTRKDALDLLTHLEDVEDPASVKLVSEWIDHLCQRLRARRKFLVQGDEDQSWARWPTRFRAGSGIFRGDDDLENHLVAATGALTPGDLYRLATQEDAVLQERSDSDGRSKTHAFARRLRGAIDLVKRGFPRQELHELTDDELTSCAALQRIAGVSVDLRMTLGDDLRACKIPPAQLPDPRLPELWGGILGLLARTYGYRALGQEMSRRYGEVEIVVDDHNVMLELRRRIELPVDAGLKGVVILSATAAYELDDLRAANPRIADWKEFGFGVESQHEHQIHTEWLRTPGLDRTWSCPSGTITLRGREAARNSLRRIVEFCLLRFPHTKPILLGILTHKPIAEWLQEQLDDGKLAKVIGKRIKITKIGWFGRDDRGTNDYQDVHCLSLLGVSRPNVGAAQADAEVLCPVRETRETVEASEFTGERTPRERWIDGYVDRRIHQGLMQAVGRGRDVRATHAQLYVVVDRSATPEDGRAYPERHPVEGAPSKSERLQVQAWTTALLESRWVVSVPLLQKVRTWVQEEEAPLELRGVLQELGPLPDLDEVHERNLRRWIKEAASKLDAVQETPKTLPKAVQRFLPRNKPFWRLNSTASKLAWKRALQTWESVL